MPPRVRGVLIDLNGTLHVGDALLPGVAEALERLRAGGVPLRFVTNTTKETTAKCIARVQRLGLDIQEHEVISSLAAAKTLLISRRLRPLLLVSPEAMADFASLECAEPNAVVVGLAPTEFCYSRLNQAFRLLLADEDAPLIAIQRALYLREADGLSLGPGPFVTALESATGRSAETVGKPEAAFFQLAVDDLGCRPEDCIMIGDDVRDDVGGAQAAGLRGVLVRTGKYRPGDETKHDDIQPEQTVESFAAAIDFVLEEWHAVREPAPDDVPQRSRVTDEDTQRQQ